MKSLLKEVPVSVWVCGGLYSLVMIAVCVFAYTHFFYTGLDLGIYDQVVWNTAHGRLFAYTFNPYSYLVDHREWLLLVVAPLYWIVASPITLLVLQTLVIASGVVPLYGIVRRVFANVRYGNRVALGAVVAYCMNPIVQHMDFFEFHVLTFALPLSLWLWLCVERRWTRAFWVCVLLLLLVREDTGLMTAGVGLLMMLHNRSLRRTGAALLVVSLLWFVAMVIVGSTLSPEGTEKFLVFYDWLGNTPGAIVAAIVSHPLRFLSVLFDYDHVVILIFLCMDVAFLVLWGLRFLLPTTFPLVLYLSLNQEMLAPVLKTHYAAVLVPWFLISAVYGYRALIEKPWFRKLRIDAVAGVLISIVLLSQWLSGGPLWEFLHDIGSVQDRDLAAYQRVIDRVASDDSAMVSPRIYPHLAEREHLYTTMHTFTGKQHFADTDYSPPEQLDWLIVEQEDVLDTAIHLPLENREHAGDRFRQLLEDNDLHLVEYTEDLFVFGKATAETSLRFPLRRSSDALAHSLNAVVDNQFQFSGWEYEATDEFGGTLQAQFAALPVRSAYDDDYYFGLTWYSEAGDIVKTKSFALGAVLEPTHTWEPGTTEQHVMEVPITHPVSAAHVEITVGRVEAQFGPFFTVWRPAPTFDPDHSQTFPLTGLLSAELEK